MRFDTKHTWLVPVSGTILIAAGCALFLGLIGVVLGPAAGALAGVFSGSIPAFLLEGLSWVAFFLPAYLWVAAIIVFLPGFRRDLLFVLLASLAPFAVVAYLARILDAARVDSTVSGAMALNAILTVVLLGILALALSILILALRKRLFGQVSPGSGFASRKSRFDSAPVNPPPAYSERLSEAPEEALFVESGSVDEDPGASNDTVYEEDRSEGFRMPPLPPALNLSSLDRPTPAEGLPGEKAEPQPDVAEALAEDIEVLEELDEQPIPVLFGRNPDYDESSPGDDTGKAAADPAMDVAY